MSGTHLYYNGVLLRDCELIEFAQVIEYDESGTDPLYSRVRITVASTLVSLHSVNAADGPPLDIPDTSDYMARQHLSTVAIPETTGESVVDRINYIQSILEQPRKDCWFALNAVTNKAPNAGYIPSNTPNLNDSYRVVLAAAGIDDFAEVDTADASVTKGGRKVTGFLSGPLGNLQVLREDVVDANNGPKPLACDIVRIMGGRSMRVQFTVEICRALCTPNTGEPSVHPVPGAKRVQGVISNRWSISESLNEKWESEITIEGTLIISDQRYKPDAMRLMTSTNLFPYARLVNRQFSTSTDGLKLKYRYTMKETGVAPPPHLIDWDGKYTERVENGGHTIGSMNVKVRGTHKVPTNLTDFNGDPIENQRQYKLYMTDWLIKLIQTRLNISSVFDPNPEAKQDVLVPIDFVVIENMKEPEVEASITVRHSNPDIIQAFATRLHNFGKTIYNAEDPSVADWDETQWPIPPAFTYDIPSAQQSLGSAYDCYYQSPCSEWHGKPEGLARKFDIAGADEAETEAGEGSVLTTAYLYGGDTSNLQPGFTPIPAALPLTTYGWSDQQLAEGFTYLHVEIDNHYKHNTGTLALPLSKPRGVDTVVFIPVHAGIQSRVFTMVATRQGAWPKVPAPKQVLTDSTFTEQLLKAEVLPSSPKLGNDGRTWEYSVQIKWEYVRSRPVGSSSGDSYRASSDPRDKTTPGGNAIPIDYFYDYSGAVEITGPA